MYDVRKFPPMDYIRNHMNSTYIFTPIFLKAILILQQNVNHQKRQISEPTFSSFYVQTMKNQRLLHAIKYCDISIKYCILYVLYCIVMVTLSQRNLQILCIVWLLGSVIRTIDYPNYRWCQLVRIIDVLLYIMKYIPFGNIGVFVLVIFGLIHNFDEAYCVLGCDIGQSGKNLAMFRAAKTCCFHFVVETSNRTQFRCCT